MLIYQHVAKAAEQTYGAIKTLNRERLQVKTAAERAAIDARIAEGMELADYDIAPQDGARLAWLYQHGEVVDRHDADAAVHVTVRLLPADRARFERRQ